MKAETFTPEVAVAVCTHSPDISRLIRVLEAVHVASDRLKPGAVEVFVIDNASAQRLGDIDFGSHAIPRQTMFIREDRLGLVHARQRAISAARAPLLVFVDDDNVISSDYLETAVSLANSMPWLGAWGGSLVGEYLEEPPANVRPLLGWIGVRRIEKQALALTAPDWDAAPVGAGMCVRREVAEHWSRLVDTQPGRRRLGVSGTGLMRCEDTDLAFCSFAVGYGTGVFPELELVHIIPPARLRFRYLVRIAMTTGYSATVLHSLYGIRPPRAFGRTSARRLLASVQRGSAVERAAGLSNWLGSAAASWTLRRQARSARIEA